MSIQLPETEIEYRNALIDAAELGATKALIEIGQLKPYFKLSEANKLYGRSNVKKWIEADLVKPIKHGERNSMVWIDKIQIMTVAKTYRF